MRTIIETVLILVGMFLPIGDFDVAYDGAPVSEHQNTIIVIPSAFPVTVEFEDFEANGETWTVHAFELNADGTRSEWPASPSGCSQQFQGPTTVLVELEAQGETETKEKKDPVLIDIKPTTDPS